VWKYGSDVVGIEYDEKDESAEDGVEEGIEGKEETDIV